MLKRERGTGSEQYAALAGEGLLKKYAPRSWVDDLRDEDEEQDSRFVSQVRYRLHLTDALSPVGYCCFTITVASYAGFEIEAHEVWLSPRYRGRGLGVALSEKVADLAVFSLKELEAKATQASIRPKLGLSVTGDVYSKSGEAFVVNTAQSLIFALEEHEWSALRLSEVVSAPYW